MKTIGRFPNFSFSSARFITAGVWLLAILAFPFHSPAQSYSSAVIADGPVAYFRFSDTSATAVNSGSLGAAANGTYVNGATKGVEAPRPPQFIGFEADNTALQLDG